MARILPGLVTPALDTARPTIAPHAGGASSPARLTHSSRRRGGACARRGTSMAGSVRSNGRDCGQPISSCAAALTAARASTRRPFTITRPRPTTPRSPLSGPRPPTRSSLLSPASVTELGTQDTSGDREAIPAHGVLPASQQPRWASIMRTEARNGEMARMPRVHTLALVMTDHPSGARDVEQC